MTTEHSISLPVLGPLPSRWGVAPLRELLLGTRNGVYKPPEFHGEGVKIVNMGELFGNPRLRDVPMKRLILTDNEAAKWALHPGDLLFARRSLVAEGAGKCSIVYEVREPTVFESSIIRARPDPERIDSHFLFYLFKSSYGSYVLDTIRRHVAVAGITGSDLISLSVPVPPIDEQRRIASVLRALDDAIDLTCVMNETLEATVRAIFRDWFVDFGPVRAKAEGRLPPGLAPEIVALFPDALDDDDKPVGWEITSLRTFATLNPESWSRKTAPAEIDYVDLANTKWGTIESTQKYAWSDAPSRAQRVLRAGDTIVGTVRPGNGSYSYVDIDGLTGSTGFAVLRPKELEFREYVYLAATAPENIERLTQLSDGAAYPAVRPDVVASTEIVNLDRKLISHFSATVGPLLSQIELNKRHNQTLAQLRDLLLPKLISGEIRVAETEQAIKAVA